jgi:hypothetical protein
MTATVHHLFPDLDAERLDDAARLADQAIWWGQQVQNARAALRSPDLYSDDELRDACATLQSRWGDATDYCQSDAMIFALNKREFIARNCPRPETSRDVLMGMRDRWDQIIVWGFVVVVAVWIGLGGLGL